MIVLPPESIQVANKLHPRFKKEAYQYGENKTYNKDEENKSSTKRLNKKTLSAFFIKQCKEVSVKMQSDKDMDRFLESEIRSKLCQESRGEVRPISIQHPKKESGHGKTTSLPSSFTESFHMDPRKNPMQLEPIADTSEPKDIIEKTPRIDIFDYANEYLERDSRGKMSHSSLENELVQDPATYLEKMDYIKETGLKGPAEKVLFTETENRRASDEHILEWLESKRDSTVLHRRATSFSCERSFQKKLSGREI